MGWTHYVYPTFGFTLAETDSYNDLVHLRARMYAPRMGRFLTRDTWEGDANKPLSFNKWGYAYENPLVNSDPNGNEPIECFHAGSHIPGCIDYQPSLINPGRAHDIQNNLYLMANPKLLGKSWEYTLKNFNTVLSKQPGGMPWWLWYTQCGGGGYSEYSKTEVIIATYISKEFSGYVNDKRVQPLWA
jgi:RHS repeat-associated protein